MLQVPRSDVDDTSVDGVLSKRRADFLYTTILGIIFLTQLVFNTFMPVIRYYLAPAEITQEAETLKLLLDAKIIDNDEDMISHN